MVLFVTINQVDSCHGCVRGTLMRDTKDTLWMNDHVLILTFESLGVGSLKRHIFGIAHDVLEDNCVEKMRLFTLNIVGEPPMK